MTSATAPDQLVYLSNRPQELAQTLRYVAHFMPWIRSTVVLTPARSVEALRAAVGDQPGPELVIVDESSLLAAGETVPDGHQVRNSFLRRILVERGPVDPIFLQSDDDYRPLKPVDPQMFVADGRLNSYAYYDLALWRRNESNFDRGQQTSYLLLSYLGAPTMGYAAHMPQVMDRQHYLAAFEAAERVNGSTSFCEWALPLNYGRLIDPDRYSQPRTFRTLGWPAYPHEWPFWRRPQELTFENFYAELYEPGQLFAGISPELDIAAPERQAFEKIRRWYGFDLAAGRLDFVPGVDDPWRRSPARRAFFKAARHARRFYEYVTLEERTTLVGLAGALRTEPSERSER